MKGPGGEQSVHPEFEQLPGRSRRFVLRVVRQDFLYHETPVAVSSVVGVDVRRIVMRPHVQMMMHDMAARGAPQQDPRVLHADDRLLSGPGQPSYSLCKRPCSPEMERPSYPQVAEQKQNINQQVAHR